jgi:acetoin utilization protein AcuB
VVTVVPDEPVHSALLLMSGGEISRVVVVAKNQPVGIITGRDLLPLGIVAGRYRRSSGRERPFIPSGINAAMLVSDVMTKNPITANPGSDLADAAYIMIRNRISGLPVVQRRKGLVGIITKTDITKALASH